MKKENEVEKIKTEKLDAPNVAFAGKEWRTNELGETKLLPSRFAPEKINTATETLHLPDSDIQTAAGAGGFYSEHAAFLLSHFRAPAGSKTTGVFYKEPKAKGDS